MFVMTLALVSYVPSEMIWNKDFESSKKIAQEESKFILLSFSGSDWCSNCIRLEKTLFESSEFSEFASKNLVLLQADFPMKKKNKLSAEQTTHNEGLAEKYNKSGAFPTVVVLNAQGKMIGELQHPKQSAQEYIAQLTAFTK